jgi:rhamnose transport system substrate-binding protein
MISMKPVAVVLASLLALTACASSNSNPDPGGDGTDGAFDTSNLQIAFVPRQTNNPVFTNIYSGVEEAAKELGGQVSLTGPADATAASQIPFIDTLTIQQADAIMVAVNDADATAPALKEAQNQGITVVPFQSRPAIDSPYPFIVEADAKGLGYVEVEMLCMTLDPCEGQIAIISATPTSPVQNEWIKWINDALDSDPAYAGLDIVTTVYGNDDPVDSVTACQGLVASYPDLKGILAPTSVGLEACAQVLSQTGTADSIVLTGLGTPNSLKQYVNDGTIKHFALWNLQDFGYLIYYVTIHQLSGEITGAEGETFTAGRLGDYTIGEDGLIVLGKPYVFDAGNVNDFDF